MNTIGHMKNHPGLRGHSVGPIYPLTVVAIGNPRRDLKWAVQASSGYISRLRFDCAEEAELYAYDLIAPLQVVPAADKSSQEISGPCVPR